MKRPQNIADARFRIHSDAVASPAENAARTLHFNATLYAHRSLARKSFNRMILILAGFCVFAAIRFIMIGAWPVVIFVAIDLIALWLAFFLNYRAARAFETVQLTDKDLILTRVSANGRAASWRFEPYWVSIKVREQGEDKNELYLRSHGETVYFGDCLMPNERREFRTELENALAKWRAKTQNPGYGASQ